MPSCSARGACRRAAGAIAHEAGRFHLVAASGDRALGEERATSRLTRRSSSPSRARTGLIIHAVTSGRRRARRESRRAADRRARARSGADRGSSRSEGDAALVQRLAQWAGRWSPLVEVDGRRTAGSTSAESRICSAASAGWCAMSQRRFAALGLTARVAIAPTAAAAWALSSLCRPAHVAMSDVDSAPLAAAARLRAAARCRHGADARAARSQDHRRAAGHAAARAGAAVPGRGEMSSMRSTGCSAASPNR